MNPAEDRCLIRERGSGAQNVVHAEPGGQRSDHDQGDPDEPGVQDPHSCPVVQCLGLDAERTTTVYRADIRKASCRDRVCQNVLISVVGVSVNKTTEKKKELADKTNKI